MSNPVVGPPVPVDARPTPKVASAATIGPLVALLLAWVAGLADVDMPVEVAAAAGGIAAAVVAYLTPQRAPVAPRRTPAAPHRKPKATDAGYVEGSVLWTVFLILAIIALVMWIL